MSRELPKELKAKTWRGNKGLFTKLTTDASGMGGALDNLEKAWNEVPWATVDSKLAFDSTDVTLDEFDKQHATAKDHPKVDAARKQLALVVALAKKTLDSWSSNKLVPSSSVKHVRDVHTKATQLIGFDAELSAGWTSLRAAVAAMPKNKLRPTAKVETGKGESEPGKDMAKIFITGAVADLKAALAATNHLSPSLTDYRLVVRSLTKVVDAMEKAKDPMYDKVTQAFKNAQAKDVNPKSDDQAGSPAAINFIKIVATVADVMKV